MKRKKRVFAVASAPGFWHAGTVHPMSILGWLAVLIVAGGCASPVSGHKMSWRTLSRGLTSGLSEPRRKVIRAEVDFLKLWAEHACDVNRPALPPSVDFEKEMVVVVAMGTRPTGGYLTEVVDVELKGRKLKVLVGEREPSPGMVQVQRVTQPFQFVALPIVTGRVEFRTVREAAKPALRQQGREAGLGSGGDARRPGARSVQPTSSPRGAVK